MMTAEVDAVTVALAQPEGDTRSGAGRAPEPWVVPLESRVQRWA
jgi:hypothetical protein